jgi:uncharacterized protein (DUF58 family)
VIRPRSKPASEQSRVAAEELSARFGALLTEARRISANVIHGAHGRRKRGSGETFWEFRHAREEDPASAIDWRRSARSDLLFVRETEWEAANTVLLWRDGSAGMNWRSEPSLPTKRDRAAVLLAALGIVLLRGGERCAIPGVSDKPGTGVGATERICQDIITGISSPENLTSGSIRGQAHLVLASDFLEGHEVWLPRLQALQQAGVSVILLHIFDPAEQRFPFAGHTLFTDPDGAERIDLGRAQLVQQKYQQRFAANRDQMAVLARKFGWLFFSHQTDHAPAEVFLALYQGLANGSGK